MENLSYFQTNLKSFIEESHPDLITSFNNLQEFDDYIETRANEALSQYESLIKEGFHQDVAIEGALATLKEGLLFSKYDFINNILQEYYPEKIQEYSSKDEYTRFVISLITDCEEIFMKYDISDKFSYNKLFETEILGKIAIIID